MAWYLAPSLAVLRTEINTRWPGRDRASDGTIGDRRHQLSKSDHNENARGSVNAMDVDEDGIDFEEVFEAIKRHPSARYVIYEETLYHRDRGWEPEDYNGDNPHDKHFHLSIDQDEDAEQDTRSWGLLDGTTTGGMTMLCKKGDKSNIVGALQIQLAYLGFYTGEKDNDYGPKTSAAVLAMRRSVGSKVDNGDDFDRWAYAQLQQANAKKYGRSEVTPAQIAAAVADHLKKNPPALPTAIKFSGGALTGITKG
jgi:hypothetical protein